jgi:hypothetical protein
VGRDVLDGADAHGGQREGDPELFCRACGMDLAIGVLHAGQPRGRQGHRHGDGLTDHRGAQVALFNVDGDALAELQFVEVLFIGAVGAFCPGAGICVVIEHARHPTLGEPPEIFYAGDLLGCGHCQSPKHSLWMRSQAY